jgi:CDP-diacylglycerol--glycerol-3-phosphate 3-phosphatidyltransferase
VTNRSFVSPATRNRVRGMAVPVALALGRLGLTPNMLTIIGFLGTCAAAIAAANQAWLAAGILLLAFGIFDLFDGALARATGRASKFGAFLDSVFDRWGEGVFYLGMVWGTLEMGLWRPVVLAAAAMASAFMVSYARAKSESLDVTQATGMAAVGLAPREVRIAILALGLIVAGFLPGIPQDMDLPGAMAYPLSAIALELALALIVVLATITTIQRILHVKRQLGQQENQ